MLQSDEIFTPEVLDNEPNDQKTISIYQEVTTDQQIETLKQQYLTLTVADMFDYDGIDAVDAALKVVVSTRRSLDKLRERVNKPLLAQKAAHDREAKRLTLLIDPIEKHLIDQKNKVAQQVQEMQTAALSRRRERIDRLQQLGMTFNVNTDLFSKKSVNDTPLELAMEDVEKMTDEQFDHFLEKVQMDYDLEQKNYADFLEFRRQQQLKPLPAAITSKPFVDLSTGESCTEAAASYVATASLAKYPLRPDDCFELPNSLVIDNDIADDEPYAVQTTAEELTQAAESQLTPFDNQIKDDRNELIEYKSQLMVLTPPQLSSFEGRLLGATIEHEYNNFLALIQAQINSL